MIDSKTTTTETKVQKRTRPLTVDGYIGSFPAEVRQKLRQLQALVREAAPEAEERISYQMPAFFLNGVLVWFAAYPKHIGFYPKASAIVKFKKELSKFKSAKGSVQFPLDRPLPVQLIGRMIRFRIQENLKSDGKKPRRPSAKGKRKTE